MPVSVLARSSVPFILGSLIVLIISHPVIAFRASHKSREMMKEIAPGLMETVAKPFEFFTNVLSYVMLGVLLITTYVLGSLVAGVLTFGVVGVLFAALLNVIVIGMEGLIVYIQDMRLHLYEWLSKFYSGTGTRFSPLVANGSLSRISSRQFRRLIVRESDEYRVSAAVLTFENRTRYLIHPSASCYRGMSLSANIIETEKNPFDVGGRGASHLASREKKRVEISKFVEYSFTMFDLNIGAATS